jgi:hypothetical protein
MSEPDGRLVEEKPHARWAEGEDWRTWNLSRSRARQLVEARIEVPGESAAATKQAHKVNSV